MMKYGIGWTEIISAAKKGGITIFWDDDYHETWIGRDIIHELKDGKPILRNKVNDRWIYLENDTLYKLNGRFFFITRQEEEELQAFKIIKEKSIDVGYFKYCLTLDDPYYSFCEGEVEITKEEFNLLRKVLGLL